MEQPGADAEKECAVLYGLRGFTQMRCVAGQPPLEFRAGPADFEGVFARRSA
jgi:hypothetical protein